jgi:hypothetical protein
MKPFLLWGTFLVGIVLITWVCRENGSETLINENSLWWVVPMFLISLFCVVHTGWIIITKIFY